MKNHLRILRLYQLLQLKCRALQHENNGLRSALKATNDRLVLTLKNVKNETQQEAEKQSDVDAELFEISSAIYERLQQIKKTGVKSNYKEAEYQYWTIKYILSKKAYHIDVVSFKAPSVRSIQRYIKTKTLQMKILESIVKVNQRIGTIWIYTDNNVNYRAKHHYLVAFILTYFINSCRHLQPVYVLHNGCVKFQHLFFIIQKVRIFNICSFDEDSSNSDK
ncbi:Hypothetical_protein [Hexamita inflata]|uniref:Hypothetical_protein n=1 Tax=Hexamita inflata TaxID=28002 RepID=A0AA86Q7S8_9EUKA|nr:Hypothetical protein HINF_LOCUS40528 [Hexamita inflata]